MITGPLKREAKLLRRHDVVLMPRIMSKLSEATEAAKTKLEDEEDQKKK